ncbi:hypothetical protein GNI_155980, partial [Gregarina niphandrodes]
TQAHFDGIKNGAPHRPNNFPRGNQSGAPLLVRSLRPYPLRPRRTRSDPISASEGLANLP